MHYSGSTILIIDDALERRAHLQGICEFLELQCHVFDFVTWLQEGKRFPLAGVGVIFLGESSLPISLSKLVAELDLPGRVMPKVLVSRQSELAGESDQTPGLFGPLSEPYRYTEMLDILHRCSLFVSQQGGDPVPELDMLVGQSPSIQEVKRLIAQVAQRDISVMITGESGTGKEVVARCLHEQSLRAEGPFVPVNCGAIPGELLESELFGHEKGAFTGAISSRAGRFELAQGGTLFLDEIGDMPIGLQAKMLRFLQERVIERVGGRNEIPVDIRVICATHRDIQTMVGEETFREDLFYRIGEIPINIPPLREREQDIVLLARTFLNQYREEFNAKAKSFSDGAIRAMLAHRWPGNIRELQNKLKSAVIMAEGTVIQADDLGLLEPSEDFESEILNLREVREQAESKAIRKAYQRADKNMSKTAELLGVTRPTLYSLIDKYHLEDLKTGV